jgi:hypothetical protein
VFKDVSKQARTAILGLIEKERNGEQIDRALLKNVLGIFIEVGMGGMDCYAEDFEKFLLMETAAFYKKKATAWIAVRVAASTWLLLKVLLCHSLAHNDMEPSYHSHGSRLRIFWMKNVGWPTHRHCSLEYMLKAKACLSPLQHSQHKACNVM